MTDTLIPDADPLDRLVREIAVLAVNHRAKGNDAVSLLLAKASGFVLRAGKALDGEAFDGKGKREQLIAFLRQKPPRGSRMGYREFKVAVMASGYSRGVYEHMGRLTELVGELMADGVVAAVEFEWSKSNGQDRCRRPGRVWIRGIEEMANDEATADSTH